MSNNIIVGANTTRNELYRRFEDPVSLEPMKITKILPGCGHSFIISERFMNWMEENKVCPMCDTPAELPLINNYYSNELFEEAERLADKVDEYAEKVVQLKKEVKDRDKTIIERNTAIEERNTRINNLAGEKQKYVGRWEMVSEQLDEFQKINYVKENLDLKSEKEKISVENANSKVEIKGLKERCDNLTRENEKHNEVVELLSKNIRKIEEQNRILLEERDNLKNRVFCLEREAKKTFKKEDCIDEVVMGIAGAILSVKNAVLCKEIKY